ncbi:hypothetical protein ACFTAO_15900 [Paenibacillus rhizoplanae]
MPEATTLDILSGDDKLINAKAYIPLEDLIEKYAPNLKKHYGAVWNQIKDESDGHIYVLPSYGVYQGKITEPTYQGPGFWLQKKVCLRKWATLLLRPWMSISTSLPNIKKKTPGHDRVRITQLRLARVPAAESPRASVGASE